ncbi:MAG TPA: hypothetical protein VGL02_02960 [Streptomyces sp.]
MMPIMYTPLRAAAGAALAVLALAAAAGCGAGGGGGQPPPPMPFGRPPSSGSTSPSSGGRTSPPPTVNLTARPTATTVSPSFSSEVHPCPTPRSKKANLCFSGRVVYPAINPSAHCVDEDIGVHGGRTYACVMGDWFELPATVTTTP